jgi:sec-independent protein translocase protein TatA
MLGLDNPIHILFLLVIVLLVFGAKRLPEMGHSLGAGLRGFKESISGEESEHGMLHLDHTAPEAVPAPVPAAEPVHAAEPVVDGTPVRPAA